MDQKINQIIDELIALDSEFEKHRNELLALLSNILAVKPNAEIDEMFILNLKRKLMETKESNTSLQENLQRLKGNFMKKFAFSMVGIAVVILATVVSLSYLNVNNPNSIRLGSKVNITRAEANAFGTLSQVGVNAGQGGSALSTDAESRSAAPTTSSLAVGKGSAGSGGGGVGLDMVVPPYQPVNYKYIYNGTPLVLDQAQLDVLKKVPPNFSGISTDLSAFGLGLVNLGSFSGGKLQSISINQDKGYNIYVDLSSGMISLSGYYDVMPLSAEADAKMICPMNGCPTPPPIDPKDVPDDATLISIANAFLSEHGISTEGFGEPVVQKDLYQIYAKYIAEYSNVVYPIKIDEREVFDESGNKAGLMVGINIRNKKVMSVSNLTTQDYQASSYAAETDVAKIMKLVERGGMYYYQDPSATKVVEIELGEPTMELVQMWDYKDNQSIQLLVPSLIFPVIKQPTDGSFFRQAVVIPLIKDILNRDTGSGGPIRILEESTLPAAAEDKK